MIQNKVKGDDIDILVVMYLLFQSQIIHGCVYNFIARSYILLVDLEMRLV